jgi:hypothetical protein
MTLSQQIKYASEYHPLEYLLTLPVMSKIEMTGEDNQEFAATGKRGLYNYQDQSNLTIRELIQLLPIQKYQFEIEFEQEERDILNEARILRSIIQRKPELSGKLKELELEIAKDPKWAYEYALNVIKGRFELGEPVIAKDAKLAYNYALNIIKGRFPLGEPAIAKDLKYAYWYARDVIKGRFPEGEPAIARDPYYAYIYAKDVIKGRFPEGEPAIAKEPYNAYYYAQDVIKGRFSLIEPEIAKDSREAYYYAKDVIKGRFPEGEPAIANNSYYSKMYNDFCKKCVTDLTLKSKSLIEYTKNPMFIYECKKEFSEWKKFPLEYQDAYVLYWFENDKKNMNVNIEVLKKWKKAKELIYSL